MHKFSLNRRDYLGVATGVASAIVVDESQDLLLNEPVLIDCSDAPDPAMEQFVLECSVNSILTSKDCPGLKKDYSVIFLSVVRRISYNELAKDK